MRRPNHSHHRNRHRHHCHHQHHSSGQQRQPWPCLAILALAAGIALTTTGPSTGASRIRPILTIKSTRKLRMKKLMTKDSLKPERQAFDYALSQDSDEPEQTRFMSDRLLEEAPESGSSRSGAKRTQPSLLSPSEPSIGSSLMQKLLPTLDLAREPKLDIKPMTSEPIPEHINSDSIEEAIELEQKKKKKKATKKSKRKVQKGEGPPFSERSSNVKTHDDAFRMKEDEISKKRGLTNAGGQQVEDAEEAAKADDGSELQQRRVKEDAARFFERLLKEAEQEKKEEGSPMDDNEQDVANDAQDDDDENDTAARLSLGEIALSSMVQGLGDNALQNEEDLIGKLEKEEEELREKENEIQKKEEKEYLRKMEENMRKRIAEQLHKKEEEEQQQPPFGPGRHVKIFDDDDDDDDNNAAVARIAARLAQNNDVEGSFPPSPFSPENQQKQSKRRDGEHGQGEREEDPKEKRGVQRGDNQPSMPPPPSNEEEHQQQNELGTQWEEAEPEEGGELRGNPGGEKDGYYYYYMNGNNRSKEAGGGAEEYINDEELQELEKQMQQQPEDDDDDAAKRAVGEDGGDDDEYMYAYQYFDPENNQTVVVSSPDQLKMMQNQSYTYENIDYDEYLRRYGAKEGDGMADNNVATTTTTNNSIKEQAADSGEAPADDIANAREELDLLIFKQRMQKAAEKREKREKEEERRRRRQRQKRAPERGWLNSPFNEDTDNDGGDDDDSRAAKMRDHHGGEQGGKKMLTAGVNAVIDQDNSQPDEEERAEILAESRQFSRIMKRSSKRERKAEAKRLSFIRNERRLARKRRIEAGELNVTQSSSGDDDADEFGQQKQGGKNLPMSFDNGNEQSSSSSSSSSSGDSSKDDKEPVILQDQVPISPWAEYTPEQRRIAREKRRAAKLIKKQAIEQAKREKELQDMSAMLDDKLVSLRIYTENEDKAAATKILDELIPLQRANKTSIFQAKCMLRCANNLRMWDYSQKIMQLLPHKEAMTWWLMPGEEDIERPASLLKPKARASSDINSWLQLLQG